MKLLSFPPSDTVTQNDLENVISLNNRIRGFEQIRDRLLDQMLAKLERGGIVEPGIHDAETTIRASGGRRTARIKVF